MKRTVVTLTALALLVAAPVADAKPRYTKAEMNPARYSAVQPNPLRYGAVQPNVLRYKSVQPNPRWSSVDAKRYRVAGVRVRY